MSPQKARCPQCESTGVPILYGFPTEEAFEAAQEGQFVLGGCVISEEDPVLACLACGERWGRRADIDDLGSPQS